jgi:hypothetical protein
MLQVELNLNHYFVDHLIEIDIADEEKLLKSFNKFKDTFKNCIKLPYLPENIFEVFEFCLFFNSVPILKFIL